MPILTGSRSGPLRNIHVDQINGDVWTVPAEDMKGRKGATKDFRVPLSIEAQRVIAEARKFARDGFLFAGAKRGVISDMTMTALMKRRGLKERPHGFRTSLRVWLAETTNAPHDVVEMCISHVVGPKVVQAYKRTDFLEQRHALMELWASFLCSRQGGPTPMKVVGSNG
ncbi:tyrosine-type recombinase/integrase [Yoonia sp. R2-816]|uniref:tyrosine-type recombinase/integrase n=1 Tax=Yoonia sp. R2-816 TaxID=3342638 RepID=UPI003728D06E